MAVHRNLGSNPVTSARPAKWLVNRIAEIWLKGRRQGESVRKGCGIVNIR
jgi:hypothetical protein